MKVYFVYGSLIALANSVATLLVYLAGLHSSQDKLSIAGYLLLAVNLGVGISLMVAGVRSKRNLTPPTYDFTFGMAMGVAVVVSLVATILSSAFQYIYQSFINPDFAEVLIQQQVTAMQAGNIPAEHIEKAEAMMRIMTKPGLQAAMGLIFGTVINVIISAIIAAIMRRKAINDEPPSQPTTR